MKPFFIFATLLLLVSCEEKEKPVQFKIVSETTYSFPAATNTASFSITSNIPWQATLKNGGDWCSVTPASANGDGNVEIFVAENTAYTQERTANIVVTAGNFSKEITVTQAPPPCPDFSPGSIASTGQTIAAGDTPATINSLQPASGIGVISYQWYKNGNAIEGATTANYRPSATDAAEAGTYTYTRQAKDDICSTTLTPSAGSWTLTVIACNFNAGAIATTGQTVCSGNAVNTITSSAAASGEYGTITYEWRRNGVAIAATNAATYTPSAYNTTVGTHTFTRWAKEDGLCVAGWTQSAGSWVLTVNGLPDIVLRAGNANQIKSQGEAIDAIIYTTANATGASLSSGALPAGITGSWSANTYTISGTISASAAMQTYNYMVTTTNSNGCTNSTVSGTITLNPAGMPGSVPTTLCTSCCYNGSSWVDCYVTTNAYPFDNTSTNTTVGWGGNSNTYYSGASGSGSDKNGRVNTAAISSTGTSAVQICKNLGTGWYLPAYEELMNMSSGSYYYSPLNGRSGANLLATPSGYYWSSTEFYNNGGRHSSSDTSFQANAVIVDTSGGLNVTSKMNNLSVRCVWRN